MKVSKEDLVCFQLKHILNDLNPPPTDIKVLAYLYLYKDESIERLMEDKVLNSEQGIRNYYSLYRKKGVIVGKGNKTKLHEGIKIFTQNIEFTIKLEIDA